MQTGRLTRWIGLTVMLAWSAGVGAKTVKAAPSVIAREIDLSVGWLEPKSIGLEIDDLLRALKPPRKDEFESTEAFVDRQKSYAQTKFLGELTPSSLIAVSGSVWRGVTPKTYYLADAGVQVVEPGPSPLTLDTRERKWPWVSLDNRHKKVATYNKRNAYGTVIEVDKVKITIEGLVFPDASIRLMPGESGPSYQIKIEPAVARGLKDNVGVLYIGRLIAPFVVENDWFQSATWSDPRDIEMTRRAAVMDLQEIWIVNTKTGRVLYKAKAPLATPAAPINPIP